MFNFTKKAKFLGGVLAVVIASFVFGVYFGYNNRPEVGKITSLLNKEPALGFAEMDFGPFWKAWNLIESKYVSNNGLERQDMIWGAISGLVESLDDPYSIFMPPKEAEMFASSVRGDFEGVGMEVGIRDNILIVVSPLKGTPAEKAGMMAGDKILKIDDVITSDLTIDEAVRLIRGERGTKVSLSILRNGADQPLQIDIIRDVIEIPVLETEYKKPETMGSAERSDNNQEGVFVIRLYNFSARSTDAFRAALREMINSGSTKLILDLRGNAGGYLEAAVDISSWFLKSGEVVAREQFGNGEERLYRSRGYNVFDELDMVILINKGSASAAEIVAGALQEHEIATLVGETSYGKGSVQELMDISKGSSLKLTIARWLTPNGNSISKNGLDPDIEVKFTVEQFQAGEDPQMDKAMEILME
ncbi:MAG: S41 family peptidase [Patescibacteria group bacterium]